MRFISSQVSWLKHLTTQLGYHPAEVHFCNNRIGTCARQAHAVTSPDTARPWFALMPGSTPAAVRFIDPSPHWLKHLTAQFSNGQTESRFCCSGIVTAAYPAHTLTLLKVGRPWVALMPSGAPTAVPFIPP
jgi:hypothetical protein